MRFLKSVIPTGDKIAVIVQKPDEVTQSGIIIPEASGKKERPQQGKVIAISPYLSSFWAQMNSQDSQGRPLPVSFITTEVKVSNIRVGETILFAQYAGDDIQMKDEETGDMQTVKVLSVESILAVIVDKEKCL